MTRGSARRSPAEIASATSGARNTGRDAGIVGDDADLDGLSGHRFARTQRDARTESQEQNGTQHRLQTHATTSKKSLQITLSSELGWF